MVWNRVSYIQQIHSVFNPLKISSYKYNFPLTWENKGDFSHVDDSDRDKKKYHMKISDENVMGFPCLDMTNSPFSTVKDKDN